jgi:putative aldouronate transport system permease protein
LYQRMNSPLDKVFNAFNYILMFMLMIIFVYPFWSTMVMSFSDPKFSGVMGIKLYPVNGISLNSYKSVFTDNIIYIGYMNTLFRTLIGTILTVLITYCGAYSLTKKQLPFRKTITLIILFTMFFSGGLVPSYLLIKQLGLVGSRWSLIVPGLTSAWSLLIARNFISSLPEAIEESAIIDGAGRLTVISRILMPLSMPIIAVLALWTAVGHWNAWFDAMIYISDRDKMVLQLVLRRILIDSDPQILSDGALTRTTAETTPETVKAATVIVSILPIILFYPILQKYFVKGVLVGSLKG